MIGNRTTHSLLTALLLAASLATPAAVFAQEHHSAAHPQMARQHPEMNQEHRAPEAFRSPRAYRPVAPPEGWDRRPPKVDHDHFNHNFRAHRSYTIGPYMRPHGWLDRTWYFGDILPAPFFAPEYWLSDYWLFDLETPPVGFEWVRYGRDALLIDLANGRVEQTVYGIFG